MKKNSLMCQFYVPLVYYNEIIKEEKKYNQRIEKFNKKKTVQLTLLINGIMNVLIVVS